MKLTNKTQENTDLDGQGSPTKLARASIRAIKSPTLVHCARQIEWENCKRHFDLNHMIRDLTSY